MARYGAVSNVRVVHKGENYDFEQDDYYPPAATSARGWIAMDRSMHPDRDAPSADYWLDEQPGHLNCGNWLDYEHCSSDEEGRTIHACAYIFRCGFTTCGSLNIGHKYCWNVGEAKAWIMETVAEYLSKLAAVAA